MKIINEANEEKVSYRLLNVMLKLQEAQERLHRYGTDTPLFAAEIHLIKCVKLGEKGMLVKEKDEGSSLRRILRVTPDGERAYRFHERLHADFDRLVEGLLSGAAEGERLFLLDFLGALDAALEGKFQSCAHR